MDEKQVRSMGCGSHGLRWEHWFRSREGREVWAAWCSVEGNGLEGELAAIGRGVRRELDHDDQVLGALVGWAQSGSTMALLALEAEMFTSLAFFVRQWSTESDTSRVADSYGAVTSRGDATADWVLSEFALVVLSCRAERSVRGALHGRMRDRFHKRTRTNRGRLLAVTDCASESDEFSFGAETGGSVDQFEMVVVSDRLQQFCRRAARTEAGAVRLGELAELVWLRDEPIAAAASRTGFSGAAARRRLARLAEFGRANPELLAC